MDYSMKQGVQMDINSREGTILLYALRRSAFQDESEVMKQEVVELKQKINIELGKIEENR